jgi:hypothetical protein
VNQIMSEQYSTFRQQHRSQPDHPEDGGTPLERLLRKSDDHGLVSGELRQELDRLFELLHRIDTLIDRTDQRIDDDVQDKPVEHTRSSEQSVQSSQADEPPAANGGIQIGGHILAFDPAEFARPPIAASPVKSSRQPQATERTQTSAQTGTPARDSDDQRTAARSERAGVRRPGQYQTLHAAGDEQLERWWVNFNGDVSLERLARLRQVLGESPFTIEARFDEITDGLIVLRIVTDHKLTEAHVDWIVRQVMSSVGLNRDAAILSSRKEKPGGQQWGSTEIS